MNTINPKKLIYSANHRGMKEMDVLLGVFSHSYVPQASSSAIQIFSRLLEEQDAHILDWCMGKQAVPSHYKSLVIEILAFHDQQR